MSGEAELAGVFEVATAFNGVKHFCRDWGCLANNNDDWVEVYLATKEFRDRLSYIKAPEQR